jgi:hypothetical protein
MVRRTTNIFFATVVLAASGCFYDIEAELYPGSGCIVPETVVYSIDIEPIIALKCAIGNCHVTSGVAPGSFETYEGLLNKVNNGTFEERIFVRQDMPPSGPLSSCEIQILQKWIDQGALNN